MYLFTRFCLISLCILAYDCVLSQPKLEFNLKKPKQFETRQLPSEKLAAKKFTSSRRFFQNNFTHYNYFFNANQKLNEIIKESKLQQLDDYTRLLPFFPYSLDETSRSSFLDSIIQKCTAGILLHDLRNDWIDNMYLVMGKAYLLRKNFDSAAMTFQYINYSFAPKEKDGYDKLIGSNAEEGSNAFTISTKEKKGAFSYMVTRPPSRNEALVWQIRTLTENGDYIDASSLIETLRHDPLFPERLKEDLSEARAYLYYKVQMWDSAATYLVKAIPNAENQSERARSWYLAGQLYQLANNYPKASEAFAKCTNIALDPVMDVYARLNSIRLNKSSDPKIIDANVASLVSMAKKDRYQSYRDIIYYAAALFELERNSYDPATAFLQKSIHYNAGNDIQRSRTFMLMGDIEFAQKKYAKASVYYDSVNAENLPEETAIVLNKRKPGCNQVHHAVQVITIQDSLLAIAKMDENTRVALVKQIAKDLRKARGIKEEPSSGQAANVPFNSQAPASPVSLFSTAGNWYFYDPSVRADGFTKFRTKWGARPNVDNWRRISAVPINIPQNTNPDVPATDTSGFVASGELEEKYDTTDISFDNLYSRIPLSEDKKERVNNRIVNAYYIKGVALHEQLEDYPEAIKAFEEVISRRDTGMLVEQSLFALVHCYTAVGDMANASRCRQLLQQKFSGTELAEKLDSKTKGTEIVKEEAATNTYQKIYDLFLEGNFDKALAEKHLADSTIGKNYWTPQLLYIEAVYHIRQREDSLAIASLNDIIHEFGDQPLAARAKTMIDVLGRRKEIEAYLTKLEITRAKEDEVVTAIPQPRRQATLTPDTLQRTIVQAPEIKLVKDTAPKLVVATPTQSSPYLIDPSSPFMVAIVLEKIDPAYVNEVFYGFNNSSRKNFNNQPVDAAKKKLKENLWVVTLRSPSFTNAQSAIDYIQYVKPVAQKEIIPWLDANKYAYIIISENNMSLLEQDPNMALYQKVLKETLPGKF